MQSPEFVVKLSITTSLITNTIAEGDILTILNGVKAIGRNHAIFEDDQINVEKIQFDDNFPDRLKTSTIAILGRAWLDSIGEGDTVEKKVNTTDSRLRTLNTVLDQLIQERTKN